MKRTPSALAPVALAVVCASAPARPAAAQEEAPPPATTPVTGCPAGCEPKGEGEGFGMGSVSVGVGAVSLGELNDRLSELGFEEIGGTVLVPSGHGRGAIGKFVIGGRGGAELGYALVRARFGRLVARALGGELGDWHETPRGALAYVITLDQLTRNIFRNQARAFSDDPLALAAAQSASSASIRAGRPRGIASGPARPTAATPS
jgi:uncharacterized protein DUF924